MSKLQLHRHIKNFVILLTKLSGEFVAIPRYDTLEVFVDLEVDGLTWLDSVEHLFQIYEGDNRTGSFLGFELEIL